MKTRQLLRTDLPKKNSTGKSLEILVLYKKKIRVVSDIHFHYDELCYLKENKGQPVSISELLLILPKEYKREYLDVTVLRHNGSSYNNPLKLSEVHLVKSLLRFKEVKELEITLEKCTSEDYKRIFG